MDLNNGDASRILIVDDTPRNVQLLGSLLKKNYKINVAVNGLKAIEMVKKIPPDLILMDVMMPECDGFEACRRLKELKDYSDIPVIFLTARSRTEDIVMGFESGGVDYIAKPFNTLELVARVRTHIELRRKTKALQALSELDGLTLIPNRRRFQTFFYREWNRCRRRLLPLALLMIDIDNFKLYNDHYGHLGGDECLKKVAAMIQSSVKRPGDLAARYGGEEFAVILSDTDLNHDTLFDENLCEMLEKMKLLNAASEVSDYVTFSVGVGVIVPDENSIPEDLIEMADAMLYRAKNEGRNRVC